MAHIHHEEEQRFSNVTWVWIAFVIILILPLVIILTGEGSSQKDITMILLSTSFAALPAAAMLFYAKLQLKIDGEGIHYKFFPIVFRWKIITKGMIESFEVSAKKNIWEKIECGYGYRRNRLTSTITMNITGEKFARIKLKDGRKLKIGTVNPENMERALRKLTSPDNY